jgi:CRISPR-associated protein Cas2
MRCLLIYDIPDDKIRTKVADFCLDYGLDRIQYSAFLGQLSSNHQEELMLKIEQKIGDAAAKVELMPICKQDWHNRLSFVQGIEP